MGIIVQTQDGSLIGKYYGEEDAMLEALIVLRLMGFVVNIIKGTVGAAYLLLHKPRNMKKKCIGCEQEDVRNGKDLCPTCINGDWMRNMIGTVIIIFALLVVYVIKYS